MAFSVIFIVKKLSDYMRHHINLLLTTHVVKLFFQATFTFDDKDSQIFP